MNDNHQQLEALVATHGWVVIKVPEDERGPGFAYTVGLFDAHAHPELFMSGLPLDSLHEILNDMAAQVVRGTRFAADVPTDDVIEGYAVVLRPIAPAALWYYLGAGLRFYGEVTFPALHVFWPDRAGRFPWDAGVDAWTRWAQPALSDGPERTTMHSPAT